MRQLLCLFVLLATAAAHADTDEKLARARAQINAYLEGERPLLRRVK